MSEWINTYKKTLIKTAIIIGMVFLGLCFIIGLINGSIWNFINHFFSIISPIIIGFVLAYLSNPIIKLFEQRLFFWIPRFKLKRLISIIVVFALIILILFILLIIIVPSLFDALYSFWDTYVINYETSFRGLAIKINSIVNEIGIVDDQLIEPDDFILWIKTNLPWMDDLSKGNFMGILSEGDTGIFDIQDILQTHDFLTILGFVLSLGSSLFNFVKNIILGIFIAIYMLMDKERCKAMARRFLNVFLSPKQVRGVIRFCKLLDKSFGGFIEGQLFDAAIVGVISYIVFWIFEMPMPILLACIIASTNVIPILGPFIGGIPAAFIVLISSPEDTLLFIILIIIIQQIDGNLICPKILGDKINISSLTTISAIIIMGGLFGVLGMIIGVPVFAVAIQLIHSWTLNTLRRKGLDTSLDHYFVGHASAIKTHDRSTSSLLKGCEAIINKIKNAFIMNNKEE